MIDLQNPWIITIVGGVVVTIITAFFINKNKENVNKNNQSNNQSNNQNTVVTTNINFDKKEIKELSNVSGTEKVGLFKDSSRILFIDDLDLTNKIKNIESAGWKNVIQIREADNIDQKEIREADIIFVDYKGIGPSKEQGLAVIRALKNRYKDSKWLILYSAHEVPLNAFNIGADSYLAKNSSVYELEQKIIEGLEKIKI